MAGKNPFLGLGFNSFSSSFSRPGSGGGGGSGDGSTIFDLTGGSLPAGMFQYTGSNAQPTLTWGSEGAIFTGDAGSGQYPLRLPTEFTGDYLFQLSTRIDEDPGEPIGVLMPVSQYLILVTLPDLVGVGNGVLKRAEFLHKIIVRNQIFTVTMLQCRCLHLMVVKF